MRTISFLIILLFFKTTTFAQKEKDIEFAEVPSIQTFEPNTQQITNLAITAQFWGFLKYHHPAVTSGNYDWDIELFKLLPNIITAKSDKDLSAALELFLDRLPQVKDCNSCNKPNELTVFKPNYGDLFTEKILSKRLTEKISFILNNAVIKKSHYVAITGDAGNPIFQNEKAYPDLKTPDASYRLLALYRYWNAVNYFFPYRDVIEQDWNLVLKEMIPVFLNARNQTEYVASALKLFASINDAHAYFIGLNSVVDEFRGKNTLPFRAKFVQEKLVVFDYFNDTDSIKSSFKKGDEIIEINGEKVSNLIKKYQPFVAASNYETKLRGLPLAFLMRSNDKVMHLVTRRGTLETIHKCTLIDYNSTYNTKKTDIKPYKIINKNIGYVYPNTYKNKDLKTIEELFKQTKGMVIDMRSYPLESMPYTFGNYIKQHKTPFAKFTSGSIAKPGSFVFGNYLLNGGSKNSYKNKIIVIVDETTQSAAEFTTMAFQSSPNVKVIGSTTAGADGTVSRILLPGGISTMISGIGIFYPDGTPTQRVGVKIDYPIKPTLKGIADGKDELLEKALELLEKGW